MVGQGPPYAHSTNPTVRCHPSRISQSTSRSDDFDGSPRSDCYNELVDIPRNIERLLWEYDLDGLDLSSEPPDAICERVMARGGWAEMQWLIRVVGAERLRSYLERRGAQVLPPREVAFWGLVCSVPDRLVQEWVGVARERQKEWRG